MAPRTHQSVPGLDEKTSSALYPVLQARLIGLIDLQLALKQAHWNVVGPDFIAVHEMLDDHVASVREMSDGVAERLRTLGGEPVGTPGAIVAGRDWDDYPLGRATVPEHLAEIDAAYAGVISDHRDAIAAASGDPVTEDLLISQAGELELLQWFVRSFLENAADSGVGMATVAAGRGPTTSEAEMAEAASESVDLDAVESNYREMTKVGAEVKGEGAIQ
jgi:starvation-inducible DNA-binding protein